MGYDVYGSGEAWIKADQVESALAALTKAAAAKGDTTVQPDWNLGKAIEEVTACFYSVDQANGDIVISPSDDAFRHLDDDLWAFEALAPFIEEGSIFEFTGEDHYQWMWTFDGKTVEDVGSEVVYGADRNAPKVCTEIVRLLYEGGAIKSHSDPQAVLDQIEELVRKAGYGPFAGMDALDAIAKAAE